ncbi:hypothetical protein HY086_03020 [Candidatus Gottesmanbacteria bacterium]|nr:hypothetical protein [Candidatus Gottesmanbacteria bacterium]
MPAHALDIPKTKLKYLYLKKLWSADAIAKVFHCDHVTILNYLKKYQIPRRSRLGTRKPVRISKKTLYRLYHKQRLTQKQIANRFGHSAYGIERWMKIYGIISRSDSEVHTKYRKKNFSGDDIEKAYLIGFRIGDLNVVRVHELVQVRCSTTIKNQMLLIKSMFAKYGYVHIWKAKRGTFEIVVLLNTTFSFLLPKDDKVKSWITTNKRYFLSFLAGYSDAEGSYYLKKPRLNIGKTKSAAFEIQSYDRNTLLSIHNKLKSYSIENIYTLSRRAGQIDRRGIKTNKDCWRVVISKKQSLWDFIKLIEPYHKHKNKIQSLQSVKRNLLFRNTQPYCNPIIL